MKKYFSTAILTVIALMNFVSCNKDDDTQPIIDPEPEAEYTIIAYGCAGGNLDESFERNFSYVEKMGYQEDVQFTAMFKYSTSWQDKDEQYEGTRLLTMEPDGEMSNKMVGGADLRLDNPQNIADFIIDAKRRLPAKKYILVLCNHGSGFDYRDQLVEPSYDTKIVCKDDNTLNTISIFELEAALKLVGEKIDMLYWNACLMNTIENNYQIHKYFDYIIGSNHVSYESNYSILINSFLKHNDIVEAGKYFTKKTIETWANFEIDTFNDLTLIECDKIERVVELIAQACDILCDYRDTLEEGSNEDYMYKYTNGDSSYEAMKYYFSDKYNEQNPEAYFTAGGAHYYYQFKYDMVDLSKSLRCLSFIIKSGELSAITTLLNDAIDDMYLSRDYLNRSEKLTDVSVPICWPSDVAYNYKYTNESIAIKSLSELYPLTEFDKATAWGSRFLAGNVMQAVAYDEENDTFYNIERK